jgi:hypothetical protein
LTGSILPCPDGRAKSNQLLRNEKTSTKRYGFIEWILPYGKGFCAIVDENLLFWRPAKTKIIFS